MVIAIASTTTEYWNSESEDGMSYFDTVNNALLPLTIGTVFGKANTSNHDNDNQAFDIGTSIATASDNLSSNTENIDMSWPLHSNGPSGTSAYNFDFMDASDEGYPYHNMNYLARFRFNPNPPLQIHPIQHLRMVFGFLTTQINGFEYRISPRKTSFPKMSAERGPNRRGLPYN